MSCTRKPRLNNLIRYIAIKKPGQADLAGFFIAGIKLPDTVQAARTTRNIPTSSDITETRIRSMFKLSLTDIESNVLEPF